MSGEGLVDWYIKLGNAAGYDFEKYVEVGEDLDDTTELSTNKVFERIMDIAKKKDITEKQLRQLNNLERRYSGDIKAEILRKPQFERDLEGRYTERITEITETELKKIPEYFKKERIDELKREVSSLSNVDDTISEIISEFEISEQISNKISDYQDKLEPYKDKSKEELIKLSKEGNREERELSRVALKEMLPRTLASLKGWDKGLRRKETHLAFQSLFK